MQKFNVDTGEFEPYIEIFTLKELSKQLSKDGITHEIRENGIYIDDKDLSLAVVSRNKVILL